MTETRICDRCEEERPITSFKTNKEGDDRLPYCRPCSQNRGVPGRKFVRPPAPTPGMTAKRLGRILSWYYELESLFERDGVDTWFFWGIEVSLHDLLRGFDELPQLEREAVYWSCLHCMSLLEAAEVMGLSGEVGEIRVGTLRRRGLKRLLVMQGHTQPDKGVE